MLTESKIIPREMFLAARAAEMAEAGGFSLLRRSTPMIMYYIVKERGWRFVATNGIGIIQGTLFRTEELIQAVFPPLFANATLGAVLYTSYLQTLASLDPDYSSSNPPLHKVAFTAGFIAGGIQSVLAAPLDALSTRMNVHEMLTGKHPTFWAYSIAKLSELGAPGIFAGYSFSFMKETLSYALFFAIFEGVKGQAHHAYVRRVYGSDPETSKPHYLVGPAFLLAAGVSASFAQQAIQHPIHKVQDIHLSRLESIDFRVEHIEHKEMAFYKRYSHSYQETFKQCGLQAKKVGGWRRWLFKGFLMDTVKQVPSTAAGLIVFEIMRRRWAEEDAEEKLA